MYATLQAVLVPAEKAAGILSIGIGREQGQGMPLYTATHSSLTSQPMAGLLTGLAAVLKG